ncbi:MAG: iron complex transport system substrate-binding protein [Planctomycetota bacterium]|jgi:iron complex transport system substrate-binding protein
MRIVSLCPSLTELVFDLGCGAELVGITDYCIHPADKVGKVETVGGTKTPDVERIVELAPDLVLLNAEENRREDAESLAEAGIACLSSMPRDAQETADMCRSIASAIGRKTEGEQIAREIEVRTERVQRDAADASAVRFAYLIWRKPWMTVNADTFAHTLLAQAGGVNVFADLETRYPEFTIEALRDAKPDVVFLCTEPFAFEDKHIVELAELTGLPKSTFRIADGEYLSWHGSRTPDGIDYAEALIHAAR